LTVNLLMFRNVVRMEIKGMHWSECWVTRWGQWCLEGTWQISLRGKVMVERGNLTLYLSGGGLEGTLFGLLISK
jgi:hypothetical protein